VSVLSQYHAVFITMALLNTFYITFHASQQINITIFASSPATDRADLIHFGNFNRCIMTSLHFNFHFINDKVLSIF
jgi:hypothetical protein